MPRRWLLNALLVLLTLFLGGGRAWTGAEKVEPPLVVHEIVEEEPVAQLDILQQVFFVPVAPPHSASTHCQLHVLNHMQDSKISDSDEYLIRSYKSPAHRQAARQIERWMQLAGMRTWQDAIGNVHGELRGVNSSASALVIGSHYDTVKDSGAFDGTLGVITAIAAIKALVATTPQCAPLTEVTDIHLSRRADTQLAATAEESSMFSFLSKVATGVPVVGVAAEATPKPAAAAGVRVRHHTGTFRDVAPCVKTFLSGPGSKLNVHVVAFTDEEGVRFQSTFLGSRALAGALPDELLRAQDQQGISIAETLDIPQCAHQPAACGDEAVEEAVADMQLRPGSIHAYVEAHMEQGPVLEASGLPVGVVSAIAGQSRWLVSLHGDQGHAGTVPMHLRKDPMPVAGSLMHAIKDHCTLPPARRDSDIMYAMHVALQQLPATPLWVQRAATTAFSKLPQRLRSWLQGLWSDPLGAASTPKTPYLVCTVGSVSLWPGASNVIPKSVNFTVDIRSDDDAARGKVEEWLQGATALACTEAGLQGCSTTLVNAANSVQCNLPLTDTLIKSAESALVAHSKRGFQSSPQASAAGECMQTMQTQGSSGDCVECEESGLGPGYSPGLPLKEESVGECGASGGAQGGSSVPLMTSGAGHDALVMADIAPMAMLFVRCRAGISHSPEEYVAPGDVVAATRVLLQFVMREAEMV